MIVGTIKGIIFLNTDRISGTLMVPWFTGDLDLQCHPWGAWILGLDANVKHSSANVDGSTKYTCQWDPITEWDFQAGQHIGVMYVESDFDRVIAEYSGYEVAIPMISK